MASVMPADDGSLKHNDPLLGRNLVAVQPATEKPNLGIVACLSPSLRSEIAGPDGRRSPNHR